MAGERSSRMICGGRRVGDRPSLVDAWRLREPMPEYDSGLMDKDRTPEYRLKQNTAALYSAGHRRALNDCKYPALEAPDTKHQNSQGYCRTQNKERAEW